MHKSFSKEFFILASNIRKKYTYLIPERRLSNSFLLKSDSKKYFVTFLSTYLLA